MKPHLAAQAVLVRMLYDPAFTDAVKAAPREVLAHLPHALADELGAIDPRALRRDTHRRERTIGQLCDELPCTTALVRDASRLLAFFASRAFHEAIIDGTPLVLALGAYLEEHVAGGPRIAAALALELASARARREGDEPSATTGDRLRRARGVIPVEVPIGALAMLELVAAHRVRRGPLPWDLWTIPGSLELPTLGAAKEPLLVISVRGEVSLVPVEPVVHALLVSLPEARSRHALVAEAKLRSGAEAAAVEAVLDGLVLDELIVSA